MNEPELICESLTVRHAAFEEAVQRIEQCYFFAQHKAEAEALAIIGPSGSGKTTAIRDFYAQHSPWRSDSGMEIPILFASVPANPTSKSLAAVLNVDEKLFINKDEIEADASVAEEHLSKLKEILGTFN